MNLPALVFVGFLGCVLAISVSGQLRFHRCCNLESEVDSRASDPLRMRMYPLGPFCGHPSPSTDEFMGVSSLLSNPRARAAPPSSLQQGEVAPESAPASLLLPLSFDR